MAAEFAEGEVAVEVVTLKEPAGAERYRELRRFAGQHLPVPCVLLEGRLVSPGIPEPDELREVIREALLHGAPAMLRRRARRRGRREVGCGGVILLRGFYGQTVEIEEDRLYDGAEELWVLDMGDRVRVGVTKVGVLLMGGIESTEFFVEPGDDIEKGGDLVFFETFKAVRYVLSPLTGEVIVVNDKVVDDPELFDDDPYGEAWLVEVRPASGDLGGFVAELTPGLCLGA